MKIQRSPPFHAHRDGHIRLLSLNIQVGLETSSYVHYVTRAWKHLLPTRGARDNLERIADLASHFDIVALQEADAGSLRTGRLNQVAHLAERSGLSHWQASVTRDLAPFARHCLGCLSRWPLRQVRSHALPGRVPGRGALEVEICPPGYEPLRLIIAHLALSRHARARQLHYLADLVSAQSDTLLLGDLNCDLSELDAHPGLRQASLQPVHEESTFPSWRPNRSIDHVLATPHVEVLDARVLDERMSDHLPVATQIRLKLESV
ncbi:endonuclease/exonuclease/phosphatase family protein [Marinobacterium aestuariivivens]|uniref:Endonuclease/exonuclease/phosphatase family protein n=1 Tax=Marinobacterium aestuariivivens TaxID=1698799 RepID=A0ABW1ZVI3_9GAMM